MPARHIPKTIVFTPTYNEKENIAGLIKELLKYGVEILVVDDNSPDGTADIVKELANKHKNVHLLLRTKDRGRGSAGKAGYKFCLEHNADYIIEMDADFSHDPKYIPEIIKNLENYDVVIGSRLIEGGKDIGRSFIRRAVTKLANLYIRLMLGIDVKDCNSGYRGFRRNALESIDVSRLFLKGPGIVQEVLYKIHLKGFRMKEIPIIFVNREKGSSKLTIKELAAGYWIIIKLKLANLFGTL